MALKRLTVEELREKAVDIFYDFMSSSTQFYTDNKYVDCLEEYPTPMDMLYKETQDSIAENSARLQMFEESIEENKSEPLCVKTLKEQMQPLLEEKGHFLNSNMSYMKELYAKTGLTDYSRNVVRIPLDKKINSYYDDLILEVLFYDDIGVNAGQYPTYKSLETTEQRRNFIIANTEITHMGLVVMGSFNNQIATVGLMGKLAFDSERVSESGICLLRDNYADFNTLTLADTMEISNNDLRQFFQSKIDLDKEDMILLAQKNIRGDEYWLYANGDDENDRELFVRYICPSTQRVYYNPVNISNLEYSNYYKEDDYSSYLDSWWSIMHLGAKVEGKEWIRC